MLPELYGYISELLYSHTVQYLYLFNQVAGYADINIIGPDAWTFNYRVVLHIQGGIEP